MSRPRRDETALEAWTSIIGVVQLIGRRAEQDTSDLPINPPQFLVLTTIKDHGTLRQRDIASRLNTTAANVSQLVSKLEESGLVERTDSGRAKVVTLTELGRQTLAEAEPRHRAFIDKQFAALTTKQICQLNELLQCLHTNE